MSENTEYLEKLVSKAKLSLADIQTDGGYLQLAQARTFIKRAIEQAEFMPDVMNSMIGSHTAELPRIVFGTRILHAGESGKALPDALRAKPTTSKVTISTKLFKAEVDVPLEVLEDNIEGEGLRGLLLGMVEERLGTDMEEILLKSDTTSSDNDLAQFDGVLKLANAHVVDAAGANISKNLFDSGYKALPKKYRRSRRNLRWITGSNTEINYRNQLSERATSAGDAFLQQDIPVQVSGITVQPVTLMPEELGGSSNQGKCLLMDPKNVRVGIWRQIRIETDYEIRSGTVVLVASVRWGWNYQEEDAVVKIDNVLAA